MKERVKKSAASFLLVLGNIMSAATAKGQLAEDISYMATDSGLIPAVPFNPAIPPSKVRGTNSGNDGALLLTRDVRTTVLTHEATGGERIETGVNDESSLLSATFDMGAGARITLMNEYSYRKATTKLASSRRPTPLEELQKTQHAAAKINIELIEGLTAGMMLRFLYRDRSILGDLGLNQNNTTHYKYNMIGYGSGLAYQTKIVGLSYSYFPPLRGKSEIFGEEKIVVEPGFLGLDAFWHPGSAWTLAVFNRKYLREIDDLAKGTTASDNQTNISLYGLDPDQYLFTDQVLSAGIGYELSKMTIVKITAGQEQAHFNFVDYQVYNRLDVRQRNNQKLDIKYNRARAQIQFVLNKGFDATFGMGTYTRKIDFPMTVNSGSYETSGKELVASLDVGF